MPFYPIPMIALAILTVWGWRHDVWQVPAVMLIGYVGMRAIVWGIPQDAEVAGGLWWLSVVAILGLMGAYVPCFLLAIAAMVSPALLIFGIRMEYMGVGPIIEEILAALAILTIGGGIYGAAHSGDASKMGMGDAAADRSGTASWFVRRSVGLAEGEGEAGRPLP